MKNSFYMLILIGSSMVSAQETSSGLEKIKLETLRLASRSYECSNQKHYFSIQSIPHGRRVIMSKVRSKKCSTQEPVTEECKVIGTSLPEGHFFYNDDSVLFGRSETYSYKGLMGGALSFKSEFKDFEVLDNLVIGNKDFYGLQFSHLKSMVQLSYADKIETFTCVAKVYEKYRYHLYDDKKSSKRKIVLRHSLAHELLSRDYEKTIWFNAHSEQY